MDRATLNAVGYRQACTVWALGLGLEDLADHDRWLATGDVAGRDPSTLAEGHEGPVHVHLVVGEA